MGRIHEGEYRRDDSGGRIQKEGDMTEETMKKNEQYIREDTGKRI